MDTKRRIIVLANSIAFTNTISGGDTLFAEVSKRLDSEKYHITVITTELGRDLWQARGKFDRIYVIPMGSRSYSLGALPIIYLLRAALVCRLIHRFLWGGHVAIYTSSDFHCDVLPALFAKITRSNISWVSRVYHIILPPSRRKGPFFINLVSYAGQRISLQLIRWKSDRILTLTGTYGELMKLKFPERRVGILDGGIDLEEIRRITSKTEKLYDCVFVGRLHETKGIFDILHAWRIVVDTRSDSKLAIIGGGPATILKAIQNEVVKNGLQKNIVFLGFLPNSEDVYKVMMSSKIYVDPEHEDGWSLSSCEAMGCGLPVVAYNLEMFGTSFKQGFRTVPLYDVEALAKVILELLGDETKLDVLSRQALEEARKCDWRKRAKEFDEAISQVQLKESYSI